MTNKKTEIKSLPMQKQFLEKVKSLVVKKKEYIEEISKLLEISTDSTYRRFRGDTSLSLEEIIRLCEFYKVDFDFESHSTNLVLFRYNYLKNLQDFEDYLKSVLKQIRKLERSKVKEIFFLALDVPMFHHFKHPTLAAFKVFFWLKNVVDDASFKNLKFQNGLIPPELLKMGKQIYDAYASISSTEIWTANTANSLISQIEFSWNSGLFESKEIALQVCKEAIDEIKLIHKKSGACSKELSNIDSSLNYNYFLYLSDMEFSNNCIYIKHDESQEVYLGFQTINNITSIDQTFCSETSQWIETLKEKSILISGLGEKQRYIFFESIFENLERLKRKISSSTVDFNITTY